MYIHVRVFATACLFCSATTANALWVDPSTIRVIDEAITYDEMQKKAEKVSAVAANTLVQHCAVEPDLSLICFLEYIHDGRVTLITTKEFSHLVERIPLMTVDGITPSDLNLVMGIVDDTDYQDAQEYVLGTYVYASEEDGQILVDAVGGNSSAWRTGGQRPLQPGAMLSELFEGSCDQSKRYAGLLASMWEGGLTSAVGGFTLGAGLGSLFGGGAGAGPGALGGTIAGGFAGSVMGAVKWYAESEDCGGTSSKESAEVHSIDQNDAAKNEEVVADKHPQDEEPQSGEGEQSQKEELENPQDQDLQTDEDDEGSKSEGDNIAITVDPDLGGGGLRPDSFQWGTIDEISYVDEALVSHHVIERGKLLGPDGVIDTDEELNGTLGSTLQIEVNGHVIDPIR